MEYLPYIAGAAVAGVTVAGLKFRAWANLSVKYSPNTPTDSSDNAILVTGASSGIGLDAALTLARAGYKVYAGVRKQSDGDKVVEMLGNATGEIVPIIIDVCKEESIEKAFKTISSEVKGLVGLVNNAGVNTQGPQEYQPLEDIRWQMEVNYFGQIAVTQKFLPLIRKEKGRIVNISSVSGTVATAFQGAYAASKFAFEAHSDSLRRELAPWGISVSVLEPGFIASLILDKASQTKKDLSAKYPAEARRLYNAWFANTNKKVPDHLVGPLSLTSEDILHAISSPRPKTRYKPGAPVFMKRLKYTYLIPDRQMDKVLSKTQWPGKDKDKVPKE